MLENRPKFHFTAQKNWMNDPNGLVYLDGQYHLFYQHNPLGDTPGNIGWGHAVSPDLLHWTEQPMAIAFANGIMAFSGSVVVDKQNSSGFGINALIALFTAHHTTKALQAQHLAFSTDQGQTWRSYDGNPVLDIGQADFRDPKVFWHEPTQGWVMLVVLPDQHKIQFYGSSNLKNWEFLSDFGPAGATGGIWEVPDIFMLQLEQQQHWVLKVDIGTGALHGGSGGQYFVGQFDGIRFTADSLKTKWLDYGKDFYAALSFANLSGRHVWLAWMNNWQYAAQTPTSPWRGAMSIPRELSLRRTTDGVCLIQQPIPELQSLRGQHFSAQNFQVGSQSKALPIGGQHLEILLELTLQTAQEFGFRFGETTIGYDTQTQEVFIKRPQPNMVGFPGRHAVVVPLEPDGLCLHIFIDTYSVEVFVQNGLFVLTDQIFPKSVGLEFYAVAGAVQVKTLTVWELA